MRGTSAALAAPTGHSIDSAFSFKAPLLDRILSNPEDPDRRNVVLDLGGPSQVLLDRLSSTRPCRVEIADLAQRGGLAEIDRVAASEEQDPAPIADLLPAPNDERLDLILCWDLPNYLSLDALRLLIGWLAPRAAPRCRLHMLIEYSKREMAERPGRYIPVADGSVTQVFASEALVEAPRYSPEDIGQALGKFSYERGVLLANGMQEFVYAWPNEPDADKPF